MTADRIQLNKTGGTFCRIQQSLTGLTSGNYTASVWMRTISGTANVGLRNDSTGINCVVTTTWQRFSVTIGPATVAGVQILLFDSIPGNDETADILAWGAQLELGGFVSSPIPTTSASVTRAADVLTYTAGVSYPLQLFAEFERVVDTGNDEYLVHVVNSGTERAFIAVNATDNAVTGQIVTAGNTGTTTSVGTVPVGATRKIAGRIALNNTQVALAGTVGTADATADLPANPTLLRVGAFDDTLRHPFGYIRRVAIVQGAGTDANLTAMTS